MYAIIKINRYSGKVVQYWNAQSLEEINKMMSQALKDGWQRTLDPHEHFKIISSK